MRNAFLRKLITKTRKISKSYPDVEISLQDECELSLLLHVYFIHTNQEGLRRKTAVSTIEDLILLFIDFGNSDIEIEEYNFRSSFCHSEYVAS